jgi:type IV pilus assembly protein PilW
MRRGLTATVIIGCLQNNRARRGDVRDAMRTPMNKRRMAGTSLVEIMIAIALGLMILAALATIFRQLQPPAYRDGTLQPADREWTLTRMDLIADDIRLAGFYGELNVKQPSLFSGAGALPNPCSTTQADWIAGIPPAHPGVRQLVRPLGFLALPFMARSTPTPSQFAASAPARRAFPGALRRTPASKAYISRRSARPSLQGARGVPYVMGVSATFDRTMKNCTHGRGPARVHWCACTSSRPATTKGNNNMPTLMRWEFDGVAAHPHAAWWRASRTSTSSTASTGTATAPQRLHGQPDDVCAGGLRGELRPRCSTGPTW